MIKKLTVVVPKRISPTVGQDPVALENFRRTTGIQKTRRWDMSTSSLAVAAASKCLMGMDPKSIGCVLLVTQSPDYSSPAMALDVVRACNLPLDIPTFDVNQSCTGFVYGLWIGESLANATEKGLYTLVICVDRLRTRATGVESLIFSDAAVACLVDGNEYQAPDFLNDPTGKESLYATRTGSLVMNGGAVFDFVTKNIPGFIKNYLKTREIKPDFLCQHQPNEMMMKIVEKRAGLEKKSLRSIGEFGNMSMCSIPATLAFNEKKIQGKEILLCGYGAGWSAAITSIKWPDEKISEIAYL